MLCACVCMYVCALSDAGIMGDFVFFVFFVNVCDRPFSAIWLVGKIIIILRGGSRSESEIQC